MRRSCSALCLLLLAGSAFGAEPMMGFYGGFGIGNANLILEDSDSPVDFEADDTAYRLIAGYRLFRYFAIEANYSDYGSPQDNVLGVPLKGEFTAFGLSAVGLIPLGNFDLMGKLGFGAWKGKLTAPVIGFRNTEDHVDPVAGLGAQYRAGRWTVRAEIDSLLLGFDDDGDGDADGDDSVDFYSISLTWSF